MDRDRPISQVFHQLLCHWSEAEDFAVIEVGIGCVWHGIRETGLLVQVDFVFTKDILWETGQLWGQDFNRLLTTKSWSLS